MRWKDVRRLLKHLLLAVVAVQGATLVALAIVDFRRKKLRKPAQFPRLPPRSVTVGSSEVTVYTYGEDLYRDMLNAIRQAKSNGATVRTDLSATLFLTDPDEYDGGELMVEDTYGVHSVKLPSGHMVLYPASSLHQVTPVTRGTRLCSFFWLQSMIRDNGRRSMLFDMDVAIQRLGAENATHPSVIQLTGVYHNLLREWGEM